MADPNEEDENGDWMTESGGFCIDCGDNFRYDDTGGYNPPCVCGAHCRSCHEANAREDDDSLAANQIDDDGEIVCGMCGQRVTLTGLCPDCDNDRNCDDDVSANTPEDTSNGN